MEETGIQEIDESGSFSKLVFHEATGTIIVQTKAPAQKDKPVLSSLYIRSIANESYTRLSPDSSCLSFDEIISDRLSPFAYTNVSNRSVHGSDTIADWAHVARISLKGDKAMETVVDPSTLLLPAPYDRGWISRLLGVNATGGALNVVAALGQTTRGTTAYRYWICELKLTDSKRQLKLIAELRDVFY